MSFLYFLEALRNPVLDFFFSLITLFGEETIFMAVGMIVFWCVDKYKGYYLLCVGFFGTVMNQFLKIVCRVPRPWIKDPNFTIVESAKEAAGGYSFPSGHTQTSVGLYGGIARVTSNKALRIAMIVLASLVALSRMYLGVHTPADVLVSLATATILIFVAWPIFKKAEHSPRTMYAVLFSFLGIMIAYLCFVLLFPFPSEVYAADAIHNLESAQKNGYTLLGCALGLIVVYTADLKWIEFETKAPLGAQILKVLGGLILVILAKELLRAPLDALLGGHLIARSLRYFIMVIVGGTLWPMTFRSFARLGKNK
ncbi:MAG: phosphatase PAP2 family protein [Oscillospiraceae bacterium]|nr:phosphatase PAP2 family protein [Oscillospiraceae bacterium]